MKVAELHALNESQGGMFIVAFLGIFVLGGHVMAPTAQRQEKSLDNCHKIGSLLFCADCGTLLDGPKDGESTITCVECDREENVSEYQDIQITTRSHPDAFPSALRQKRKTQTKVHVEGDHGLLVTERCPACGHAEAYSKEIQMRSADEGSTILYACAACKYGWRVNN